MCEVCMCVCVCVGGVTLPIVRKGWLLKSITCKRVGAVSCNLGEWDGKTNHEPLKCYAPCFGLEVGVGRWEGGGHRLVEGCRGADAFFFCHDVTLAVGLCCRNPKTSPRICSSLNGRNSASGEDHSHAAGACDGRVHGQYNSRVPFITASVPSRVAVRYLLPCSPPPPHR